MKRAVIVLERSITMTKEVWRMPTTRRTLSVLDAGPLLVQCWRESFPAASERCVITASLTEDGRALSSPPQVKQAPEKARLAVFAIEFRVGPIPLRIDSKLCLQELGMPRRETTRIALLTPWNPVRVIVNGRASSTSETFYSVVDYYVCLAEDEPPAVLPEIKSFDLQADLA